MIRVGLSRRTIFNRMVRQDFAYISALAPAAWYRYNTGITVAGAGVDTWADQSGNGRDLRQTTDTNRPALQADGSILFDGVDNFLSASFTHVSPVTWYGLLKPVSLTAGARVFSGTTGTVVVLETAAAAQLFCTGAAATNASFVAGAYIAFGAVFNGASSVFQVNNAIAAGDPGTNDPGGLAVGASSGGTSPSNIQVKEVILFPAAHDATQRGMVIRYLARVGGLSI